MTDTKPSTALLRTVAAALVAAATVASCTSGGATRAAPDAASSTSATSADTAADPAENTDPEAAPADFEQAATAELTAAAGTPTDAEPAAAAGTPDAAADAAATGGTTAAAESLAATTALADTSAAVLPWDLSPLANHMGYDAVSGARMQAPNPAVIRIPRLDVDAPIIPLGLQDDGTIEIPENPDHAGWWLGGPEPGEVGPAVILGHVDSQEKGPAVFFDLRYLKTGDEIHVDRVDGSTVTYVVDFLESHDKDEFPTEAVYGPTEQPTLRLVTCGGDFDFDVRTYEENVIVFASLA